MAHPVSYIIFDIVLSVDGESVQARGHWNGAWTNSHNIGPIMVWEAFAAAVYRAARCGQVFDRKLSRD